MKILLPFLFLSLVASAPCTAQLLIPYLGKNGITGFADVDGKVVVQPQFTEVQEYFHPKLPAVRANKDGQIVWVLRNGAAIPDPNRQAQTMYALNQLRPGANAPTDTLKHLSVVYFRDKQVLVNLRTGKQVEFPYDPTNGVRPWFPIVERPILRNGGYAGHFLDGLMLVGRPGGLVNYLDTSLNLVFPQDYPAMTTAGPSAIFVANAEHKVAIADRKGRLLTPFKFGVLVPTDREGYYIADPPVPGVELGPGVKAGVVNDKGEYVIPAKYGDLRPAGKQFFIVKTAEGEGVVDLAGNTLMPPGPGRLSFAEGDAFIHVLEGKRRIVRATGGLLVDEEFTFLSWVEKSATTQPHFRFQNSHTSGAIAPDGRLIFRDSVVRHLLTVNHKNKTFFITSKKGNDGKELHGLVDFSGKEVLPLEYDQIENWTNDKYFQVKKGGLVGLFDMEFKTVLPIIFGNLYFSWRSEGNRLFGLEPGKHIWQAFDDKGKRIPADDCLHPFEAKQEPVYVPNLLNKPTTIITKENGEMPLPTELRNWKNPVIKGAETPAGLMVAAYSGIDKQAFFYDKNMKPLLSDGFHVPIEHFNSGSFRMLEFTGLLTVYQYEGVLSEVAALQERVLTQGELEEMPDARPVPHPDEDPVPELEVVKPDFNNTGVGVKTEMPTYTNTGTGVMNATGEWVIKPKAGARFQPISWNLVIEYPLDGPQKNHPMRMHRVNHPQPATFDITGADWNYDGRDEPDNFKAYLRKGTNTPQQQTFYTWFTYKGEQLAPFHFTHGPGRLKSHNAVRSLENGRPRWLIVDKRCRPIAAFDGMDDEQMAHFKNGHLVLSKNGLFGLVDSTGREVLPFRFKNLSMDEYGPYLREFDPDTKKWHLLDWQGQTLYESDYHIETRVDEKTGTQMIGFDMNSNEDYRNARMLFLSAEGKALGEVRGRFSGSAFVPDRAGFYKFMGPDGKEFWVDVTRGLEYRER